jgi:hypothetical protein
MFLKNFQAFTVSSLLVTVHPRVAALTPLKVLKERYVYPQLT